MKKIAVLFATGFEEIEALVPVDVFRRAGYTVDTLGVDGEVVSGSHAIPVVMDALLSAKKDQRYDVIVLPGGLPGAENLRDNQEVIEFVQAHHQQGAIVAAICAAPIALDRAGVLVNTRFTCYPGFEEQIETSKQYTQAIVESDGNIITGRGAGAAFEFAYFIMEQLGQSSQTLRDGMRYSEVLSNTK